MNAAEDIFADARDLADPAARAALLDRACGTDAALRAQVEALLRDADAARDFFGETEFGSDCAPEVPSAEAPGSVIGRYRLLEQIGEGGMGVVFMAEQREPVARRVALKVIKPGLDTRGVIARFEAERQALALMDHPHIAKVLDAGATASGRPYFVMELVQGVPITEFCVRNKLTVAERLRLFLPVCHAVQHAHQKGVIHRDLKPSNILVTQSHGAPHPLVIDFGVAKATQQRLTEKTLFTNFGSLIGTPAYMSPEQAELGREDVDTRSDLYSLGVLLYELLTGTTPFPEKRLRSAGLGEMQRIIREEEPERPSTRLMKELGRSGLGSARVARAASGVAPKARSSIPASSGERQTDQVAGGAPATARGTRALPAQHSALDADLDWIVMKCLEKDRRRRYETVNGLAADLQRHLASEPVTARPPSTAYRLQKLVQRHRPASLAVVLVTLAVVLGGTVSTWALIRERAARSREQVALGHASQRLDAALAFVDQVLTNVAPKIRMVAGAAKAQEALLQSGLDFMQRLREGVDDDPSARVALARLLLYMSGQQSPGQPNTVGDYQAAVERAEEALQLLSHEIPGLDEPERLGLLYDGNFFLISALFGLARWDEGIRRSQEIETVLDQLERIPERARRARRNRMLIRYNAGWATYLSGRPGDALTNHVLPVLQSTWAKGITDSSEDDELHVLTITHDLASNVHALHRDFASMLPHAREALRLSELLAQRLPGNAFYGDITDQCRAWYGLALLRTGSVEPGLSAMAEARAAVETRAERQASSESFRRHQVIIMAVQALALAGWSTETAASPAERRRRLAQAEDSLAEAEKLSQTVKSRTGALPAAVAEVAAARAALGGC